MRCKALVCCQHPVGTLRLVASVDNEGLPPAPALSVWVMAPGGEEPAFGPSVSATHPLGDSDLGVEQTEGSPQAFWESSRGWDPG